MKIYEIIFQSTLAFERQLIDDLSVQKQSYFQKIGRVKKTTPPSQPFALRLLTLA